MPRYVRSSIRDFSVGDVVVCYQPFLEMDEAVANTDCGSWFLARVTDRDNGDWVRVSSLDSIFENDYDGDMYPIYHANNLPRGLPAGVYPAVESALQGIDETEEEPEPGVSRLLQFCRNEITSI